VSRKDAQMVNELLAAGAQPDLQEKGADGRMRPAALHFAAMNKDTAMIAVLIGAGAQRGTPGPMAPIFYFMEASASDAHGTRANWSAAITVAERAGLSMNDLDETGGTLLHWAAGRGEVALLELLLERRVDRLRQDAGGAFAFQHLAAWYENRTSEPGPDFDFVLKALAAGVPDINAPAKLRQSVMGGSQTESNWTIARAAVAKPRVRAVFGKDINYAMLDASASQMGWPFKDRLEAEQLLADLSLAQIGTAVALPAALRARGWDDLAQLAERKR
jgi:ankyrin repeat protein